MKMIISIVIIDLFDRWIKIHLMKHLHDYRSLLMKTILIVDDEPAARYGLRRALESKYRIAEADSAEAAREAGVART